MYDILVVNQNYASDETNALSVRRGDLVEVLQRDNDGNQIGAKYVKEIFKYRTKINLF